MISMEDSSAENELQMKVLMFPDHPKEFQCPVCAKYFSRKFTLDAHLLIHKGEKPYPCQFCGKSFRQKGTLMRHKALHSSKNLFHCSLCNHGFRQKNVFIFHLRHRHNVSTETLDRRKYRTEPKDYQSIMDTLPPFVHADSAAISSSEKHFDTILYESIQNSVSNSELLQYNCTVEDNLQDVHSSNTSLNTEVVSQEDHMSITFNDHLNTELSVRNPSMLPTDTTNSVFSHLNNVTSSDDFSDKNITCIPCQLNFNSETDFKYHMKTHVQSVLLSDVNADETETFSDDVSRENSFRNSVDIPDSLNMCNEITFPVKTEILDTEIDNLSQSSNVQIPVTSSILPEKTSSGNQSTLKCPICKVSFDSDSAFKKHSQSHDSYSLLKLICESLGNKKESSRHKKHFSHISAACSDSCSPAQHINNNKKSQLKVQKIASHIKKSLMQTKKMSKKSKSAFKIFICGQCDKKFPNKFLLEYHRQLHLSIKGFFCRCCRKRFSSKKLLLSHTRLHHIKIFTCCKCFQVFNYRSLFDSHQKQCLKNADTNMSNGSRINFPVMSIESLLNSDMNDIVGIIPVYTQQGQENRLKAGIPVMSVSHIKALHSL